MSTKANSAPLERATLASINPDLSYSVQDAARYLDTTPPHLVKLRARGLGPKFIKLGQYLRVTGAELSRYQSEGDV